MTTEIPYFQPQAGSLPDDSQAQQADAWRAVCAALHDVVPGWLDRQAPAVELAVSAIRRLAAVPAPEGEPTWKVGNEFAPHHPDASHVAPDYRDGWNACYRAALAAQPQAAPARLPPVLTDEMRAVLANERCVYGSADELYAALLAAAPAPQAPVALTPEQIERGLHAAVEVPTVYERAAFGKGVRFAERAHGIPAPQTKEPTNDR